MLRNRQSLAQPPSVGRGLLAILLIALAVGSVLPASAKELGVFGKVWGIIEIDIRELLVASAARADIGQVQDELRQSAERFLDNLPKRQLGQVEATRTQWIDPSFVLDDDIRAPIRNAQGEWEWGILYAKGTRFNPLSAQRPYNAMLFFDGAAEDQLTFLTELLERYPGRVMPVEVTGTNPEKLAERLGVPVFSLTDSMMQRFRITATPSLLYAGEGAQSLQLGLTTFAAPYSAEEAERVWPSIRIPISGGLR